MEYAFENIDKFQIFAQTSPDSGTTKGYGFVQEGDIRSIAPNPQFDFYLPVFITRTCSLSEYVNTTYDPTVFTMQRQEVNPFFLEFGFFNTIQRNTINESANLTLILLNYIRTVRVDVSTFSDNDLKFWYDNIGRYEFPWNQGQLNQTDAETLDKISLNSQNIVSKAHFINIDVNK